MAREERIAARIAKLRRRLAGLEGRQYWQRLSELLPSTGLDKLLAADAQADATDPAAVSRRRFLALSAASLGLAGLGGCGVQAPEEEIVPYVRPPEQIIPGMPLYFATAMPSPSGGIGLVVESREGRPLKVEGNPQHPSSLGGSDIFCQASILDLYDPDRATAITSPGRIRTWEEFQLAVRSTVGGLRKRKGAGLRLLSEPTSSPSLAGQIRQLLAELPEARWHQYDPLSQEAAREGARQAFGRVLAAHYRLDQADVILSLGADFLTEGPGHIRYARDFAARRTAAVDARDPAPATNRLYMVQATVTATGVKADHCWPLRPSQFEWFARSVAARLGDRFKSLDPGPGPIPDEVLAAVARDLTAHRGTSVVIAGREQPAAVHALAHAMNAELGSAGKAVIYSEPLEADPVDEVRSLRELVDDMDQGRVEALIILGGNPAQTAPVDIAFARALAAEDDKKKPRVPMRVHWTLAENETSRLCNWVVPAAHYLESWGDVRAHDGTAAIIQPLIAPLHGGRMELEMIAALGSDTPRTPYELLREHWRRHVEQAGRPGDCFEPFWSQALRDGVIPGTAAKPVDVAVSDSFRPGPLEAAAKTPSDMEIAFRPDPTLVDGRFANNGWLQELPKPVTRLCWGNAALVSPATAARLQLSQHPAFPGGERGRARTDVVEIRYRGRTLRIPAWAVAGQPDDTVTLYLGSGRSRAGRVGTGVGVDAYALRLSGQPWSDAGVEVARTGQTEDVACAQFAHDSQGRDLIRFAGHEAGAKHGHSSGEAAPSFYPPFPYLRHKWGMAIDLTACVGCNACVVACQAENNIPVIGAEEVKRGRLMHWIRVDYYREQVEGYAAEGFQPVPCMQCEKAPCEIVCPVAATVHSEEGLNDMVYNRCVGTRYCSNNCPYKVRRFNFLQYAAGDVLSMLYNPEVTVRSRGVMEKCTYCVQRILKGRIAAARDDRPLVEGEVRTACQAACPARAIHFGDLNNPQSAVVRAKSGARNYALLGELNTLPRTTYLSVARNPNPEIKTV